MAKKKTVWKTAASQKLDRTPVEALQQTFLEIIHGTHKACGELVDLYNELGRSLDKIEKLGHPEERITALASFFACDNVLMSDPDIAEEFGELFEDAASVYAENAAQISPENLVTSITALASGYEGVMGGRDVLFAQADSFLTADRIRAMCESFLAAEGDAAQNLHWAVQPLSDSIMDAGLYERSVWRMDSAPDTGKLIDVANAYLLAGNAAMALEKLENIEPADDHQREEYFDIKVASLEQTGRKDEALVYARLLYKSFPNAFNLARLCQLVTPTECDELLAAHGNDLDRDQEVEFALLLASLEKWSTLEAFIDSDHQRFMGCEPDERALLREKLVESEQAALAKRIP